MRILIKLSGESIPTNEQDIEKIAYLKAFLDKVKELIDKNIRVCIVIGGGNIYRGGQRTLINRIIGDRVGMLSTIINSLILSDMANTCNIPNAILSSIYIPQICNVFNINDALAQITDKLLIFAGGIGVSLVTTDTAAVIRAVEMQCSMIIKLTQVDGVYSKNPYEFDDAIRYDRITYNKAITDRLEVMDLIAFEIAQSNKIITKVGKFIESTSLVNIASNDVESINEGFTIIY